MNRKMSQYQRIMISAALTTLAVVLTGAGTYAAESAGAQSGQKSQVAMGKKGLQLGAKVFVASDALNFRKAPSLSSDVVIGKLALNDEVQIVDLLDSATALIKVKILKSSKFEAGSVGFVSADYVKKEVTKTSAGGPSKYIVIQNVATEKTRVYERCTATPGCAHKMVMETEFVAGRTEGSMKDPNRYLTWLGRYKITEWKKFYEDGESHYPSWYHPNYPAVPYNPSDAKIWFSKSVMPGGQGSMRGAFGWYTAFVAPNSNYQWIHGTIGWGIEGDRYIKYTRGFWVNIFGNPRSSGCTRVENRAIAYLRDILEVGTEIIRVYAKEGYRDSARARYQGHEQSLPWEWILTKESVQANGATSARNSVMARNVSNSMILEYGTYNVDRFPDAMGISPSESQRSGKSGNTYKIDESEFQGTFLVDEGQFVGYKHPRSLPKGGFAENDLPEYLRTGGSFKLAPRGASSFNQGNSNNSFDSNNYGGG